MNQLKLSFAEWSFFNSKIHDPVAFYKKVRDIGYDAAEMVAPERWEAAKAAGVKILNQSGPGMQKGFNRIANHPALIKEVEQALRTASKNNIAQVIVFSGNREGQDDAEGLRNCLVAYKQLAKTAEGEGVTLLFEMLNSFDHADYQGDHSRFGFELVRAVNSPALKVLYDIYHLQRMGEELEKTIVKNLDIIAHFHIAGSPKRDYPDDKDQIDYRTIVKAVHKAGYKGYWGMEFCHSADALADLERAYKQFQGYL
jgi:hydroxypyruvate isomerase